MKLRIKGAAVRLRLTRGEVAALARDGVVEEHVPFAAGARLVYRLCRDATTREIAATFREGVVEVRVPDALAREWCWSERVTLAHSQPAPGGALAITLEKDFACLAPRAGEDESDSFPHPEAAKGKTC
ncbi:MAG: hypothetical protein JO173_09865 [Gammaproteobacteria bacterium]|nr:hypothetical protein [Gammaproteobacteria bacterium]